MRLEDLTVEVRDKNLFRVGVIRPEDLEMTLTNDHNNVSAWSLSLGVEHRLAHVLSTPGSGVIITGPDDVVLSGPVTAAKFTASAQDPLGMVQFEGVSDSIVLSDMLAFPEPTNVNPTTQLLSHDVRSGPAETVMHGFVNFNCGPGAPISRRKPGLIMGADGARGPVVTKSARFNILGTLLNDLAIVAKLGFRVVQRGASLVFETFPVEDRSAYIRLDVHNGTLASQAVAITPPTATQVIVAGQGELVQRQFYAATSTTALAAEADWNRRIERFVDQRQTDDPNEHIQAAAEVLADGGFTKVSVQVVPTDDSTMRYGHDWGLGDVVAVIVGAAEYKSTVTGMVLKVGPDGLRLGAILGDPTEFDGSASTAHRLRDAERRLNYLETR